MQARLFTSPIMKVSQVREWCKKAVENKEKLAQVDLVMKSEVYNRFKKEKAAS